MNRLDRIIKFRDKINANLVATRKLIRIDDLYPEELEGLIDLYDEYEVGRLYIKDEILKYKGKLYRVIKGLTSQIQFPPDTTPSEYTPVVPENVIPEWTPPTGQHDAPNVGDKRIYKGVVWVSQINGNTTVPDGDVPHNRFWKPEV